MSTSAIIILVMAVVILVLVAATQRGGPRVTQIDQRTEREKDKCE